MGWVTPTPAPSSSGLRQGSRRGMYTVRDLWLLSSPGTRAEVSEDQVATVVWDYFIQLGNNAKEAMEKIQKSDITQQLK